MILITAQPTTAGQYCLCRSSSAGIPEGFLWWPDNLDRTTFDQYEGFIKLTTARRTVDSYEANVEAYEAWKASQTPPAPTDTEILDALLGVSE